MAEIKARTTTENHVILGKVVPLAEPFVVVLDPSNVCNMKCKFCPSGDLKLIKSTGRVQGFFDYDLFTKVIDGIKEWDEPLRVLRLYKEGEPLLNPRFSDMVRYARDSEAVKWIDTTSNGLALRPELNQKMVDAGLDRIHISVNGVSDEKIEFYTRTKVHFEDYVANIRDLYERSRGKTSIYIKSIIENLTEEEQRKFYDTFLPICDMVFLEHISTPWPEFQFDASVPMKFTKGHLGQEAFDKDVCPYIFYMQVVNSDGTCDFCIGDWRHCKKPGDLHEVTLKEAWNGEVLTEARRGMVLGKRCKMEFCKHCEVVKYGTLDNLDPYKSEILARMDAATCAKCT